VISICGEHNSLVHMMSALWAASQGTPRTEVMSHPRIDIDGHIVRGQRKKNHLESPNLVKTVTR
jgi:hypothetical protein